MHALQVRSNPVHLLTGAESQRDTRTSLNKNLLPLHKPIGGRVALLSFPVVDGVDVGLVHVVLLDTLAALVTAVIGIMIQLRILHLLRRNTTVKERHKLLPAERRLHDNASAGSGTPAKTKPEDELRKPKESED
ncbi:hypothetical protein EYF80_006358 [Liparis tanakae]|uniref:Uncharacterized protein n=1 Tax=Liparis tanakae TaxID=230148 RepID=A0A4Z2J044_9TELE|nr:hypothetical protein EYF80_006358 [Liparis tanakae]